MVQDHQSAGYEVDALRAVAIKRLKAKRELQAHALVYLLVNGFLVVVWFMTGADFFWPAFSIFGWGIGLAMHAWDTYSPKPTEDRIQAEMNRLRRSM